MTPGKFGCYSIFGRQKSRQNSLSDNVLFYTAPVSQYDLNDSADNKLTSMDSVLVDIENVVIM